MYEVELKLRADHDEVEAALDRIGAEPAGTVTQVDTYYDHPVREFAETDEALRIRRETQDIEDRAKITYKGPLVDAASKTREELETGVEDGDTVAGILESVGFDPAASVEKTRHRYEYEEYTITLDTIEGLGEFVEIETEAEEVDPAREGAIQVLEELSLDPAEGIRHSYLGMLLDGK